MHNKNKMLFMIIILAVIIAIIIFVPRCTAKRRNKSPTPDIPDVTFNGDVGYSPGQSNNGVVVHATTGFIFTADSLNQKVNIENPARNIYDFIASIYLGDGTMLYQSEYIHPGDCVKDVQITQTLKQGVYKNSVIVYRFYSMDDSHTIISQCEFPIEIRCIN